MKLIAKALTMPSEKANIRYCKRATLEHCGSNVCRKNPDDPEREKIGLNAYTFVSKSPIFGETLTTG